MVRNDRTQAASLRTTAHPSRPRNGGEFLQKIPSHPSPASRWLRYLNPRRRRAILKRDRFSITSNPGAPVLPSPPPIRFPTPINRFRRHLRPRHQPATVCAGVPGDFVFDHPHLPHIPPARTERTRWGKTARGQRSRTRITQGRQGAKKEMPSTM